MDNKDIASVLAELGGTIIRALLDRGVGTKRATDAGERYLDLVSRMATEARNFKTLGGSGIVSIRDLEPETLQTIVVLQKSEWGRIWLDDKDGLCFRYTSERGQGTRFQEESSFQV
jgi:hypothetical protein